MTITDLPIADVKLNERNPRKITDEKFAQLVASIREFPLMMKLRPIIVDKDNVVIGGNMRLRAIKALGWESAPVVKADELTDDEKRRLVIVDNLSYGFWDAEVLAADYDVPELEKWGMDMSAFGVTPGEAADQAKNGSLADRFLIPPFSVFDTRQGYWQDRKRAWLSLGIRSEVGRGDNLIGYSETAGIERKSYAKTMKGQDSLNDITENYVTGTSIFDPVLCEIAYKWFNVPGGSILDPFAGGSVRGIVAAKLGYKYTGVELSKDQVLANLEQAVELKSPEQINWLNGDSRNVKLIAPGEYDMIFSCPPYADLERYSDDPADLSTLKYGEFREAYEGIIRDTISMLKPNRFAVFVVTEVRGKDGNYRGFVPDTIQAFEDAGAHFYNEIILVNSIGSLPIRVGRMFKAGRKVGRTHQNVLVFFKGDPSTIKATYGETIDIDETIGETAPSEAV